MKKYIGFLMACLMLACSFSLMAEQQSPPQKTSQVNDIAVQMHDTLAASGVSANLAYVTNKVEKAFDAIATKLAVPAEHAWKILVKQQIVNAYCNLIVMFLTLLFISATIAWAFYCNKIDPETLKPGRSKPKTRFDEWQDSAWAPFIIMSLISVGLLIGSLVLIPSTISGFGNPEYGALKVIMEILN